RLATRVIEVASGEARSYPGTYADFARTRAAALGAAIEVPSVAPQPRPHMPTPSEQDPAARRRLAADLREAERQVTRAEERLRTIEAALSDPAGYVGDLAALGREHAALVQTVEGLTARWAELAEAAENVA